MIVAGTKTCTKAGNGCDSRKNGELVPSCVSTSQREPAFHDLDDVWLLMSPCDQSTPKRLFTESLRLVTANRLEVLMEHVRIFESLLSASSELFLERCSKRMPEKCKARRLIALRQEIPQLRDVSHGLHARVHIDRARKPGQVPVRTHLDFPRTSDGIFGEERRDSSNLPAVPVKVLLVREADEFFIEVRLYAGKRIPVANDAGEDDDAAQEILLALPSLPMSTLLERELSPVASETARANTDEELVTRRALRYEMPGHE